MTQNAIQVLAEEHTKLQTLFDLVSSPDEDRPAVLKQLVLTLSAHVSMEKQLVVPVLKERINGGGDLAEQLTNYHDAVERVLVLLDRRKVNSPDVPDLVTELLELTKGHIANAEVALTPALEAGLTSEGLTDLGATMLSDERRLLTHPHPHLPDSGPIAEATRWAASLVDRSRDRSADTNRAAT